MFTELFTSFKMLCPQNILEKYLQFVNKSAYEMFWCPTLTFTDLKFLSKFTRKFHNL